MSFFFMCLSVWCSCTLVFTAQRPSQCSGGCDPLASERRPPELSLVAWECWWLLWWSGCSGSSGVFAHQRACSNWSGYFMKKKQNLLANSLLVSCCYKRHESCYSLQVLNISNSVASIKCPCPCFSCLFVLLEVCPCSPPKKEMDMSQMQNRRHWGDTQGYSQRRERNKDREVATTHKYATRN